MIATDKPNPFWILRLPVDAGVEQIVAHGQELGETGDEAQRALAAWAVDVLTTHPRTRALYELFEMPDTDYDDAWQRFARRHRRNPALSRVVGEPSSSRDAFDLVALVDALVEDLERVPEPDIALALAGPPVMPGVGPGPLEVWDVLFG